MEKKKSNRRSAAGYLVSAAAFVAVMFLFLSGVRMIAGRAGQESTDTLKAGIARAAVQCYAIEGRYPPSVDYLIENYGVQINYDRYQVFYSGFASNIMPDITVVEKEP